MFKIDTWEEWQEFQSTFDIEQGGEYTAEFFKENSLLMVCISCSSSYEIAVEDLINNGNICCVMLKATLPGEEMTDDIANWIYSFEVKKEWIEYCSYYDSWIQEK